MNEGKMINSLFLLEDNDLFVSMFESATECLDFFVKLDIYNFAEDAEKQYKVLIDEGKKPKVVFVDLNLEGSSFNGLEFIRKVNFEYGNEVVIGVITTSDDEMEKTTAKKYGAMFWINKAGDLEEILEKFYTQDLPLFSTRKLMWEEYK